MAHFFTADTHFADDPVRRFFERPFASSAAMDAAMISRAGVVGAEDDDDLRAGVVDQVQRLEDRVGAAGVPARAEPLLRRHWRTLASKKAVRDYDATATS